MSDSIPILCRVTVTSHEDRNQSIVPAIEIKRRTTDIELMKTIIWCAIHEQPMTIIPSFQDKLRSIASLVNKGILYYDREKGQYFFTM